MTKQPLSSCPMMTAWRDNPTVSGDPLWHRSGFLIGWPRHGFFAVDICSARLPRPARRGCEETVIMAVEGVLYCYCTATIERGPHMTLHRTPAGILLGTCSCAGCRTGDRLCGLLYVGSRPCLGGKKKKAQPSSLGSALRWANGK
jgi:hypothetical protein